MYYIHLQLLARSDASWFQLLKFMDPNNGTHVRRAQWVTRFPPTRTTRATPTNSRVWLSWLLVLASAVGFIGFVYEPLTSILTELALDIRQSQEVDCYWILLSASLVKSFSLPLPVDETAHRTVLNAVGWVEPEVQLSSLVNGRSLVCSQLSASVSFGEEFVKQLAYTCSDRKYTDLSFNKAIRETRQQLESTLTHLNDLAAHYASMEDDYNKLRLSTAQALRKGLLSPTKVWFMRNQPQDLIRWRVRIDFYKWWGLPWKEKIRKSDEAESGMAALNRESQRLEQIRLVIQELKRSVELLTGGVNQWYTEFNDDGIPRQKRMQNWFHQHIYSNQDLWKLWMKLSMKSVNDPEERLLINITPDWCKRQDLGGEDNW